MASLDNISKRQLEKYLKMGGGYVLNFTNRTFADFFDGYGIDIDSEKYFYGSGSKANKLRGFWAVSDEVLVGKVLHGLIEHSDAEYERNYDTHSESDIDLRLKCIDIANFLISGKVKPIKSKPLRVQQTPKRAPSNRVAKSPQTPFVWRSSLATQKSPIQPINSKENSPILKTELAIKTEDIIQSENASMKKKVFIVHGHNENLRLKVENFIRMVGLEPIILMDQANSGNTIIEKFEKNSEVDYAVILYTGCDEGRKLGSSHLKKRARQNVVFEHGYFISRLGRSKVAAMVEEGVEIQNDIQGVVYIDVDSDWKTRLLKEFKGAGLSFDANSLF